MFPISLNYSKAFEIRLRSLLIKSVVSGWHPDLIEQIATTSQWENNILLVPLNLVDEHACDLLSTHYIDHIHRKLLFILWRPGERRESCVARILIAFCKFTTSTDLATSCGRLCSLLFVE